MDKTPKPRDPRWREREEARFRRGEYKRLPWRGEVLVNYIPWAHFAHISREDPSLLAFTESDEKGERDIQTRIKPGKYLKRFFGEGGMFSAAFSLSEKQIAYYAEWFAKGERPPSDLAKGAELRFAKTPSEIVEAYEEGPTSCMSDNDCVRVYGAGDLAIAYLWDEARAESGNPCLIARCLCWPEKRVYSRIYPSPDYWETDGWASEREAREVGDALASALRAEGYVALTEGVEGRNFEGARILAEPDSREGKGYYVMPYIDGRMGVKWNEDKSGFILTHERALSSCSETDGCIYAGGARIANCANCDRDIHEGDDYDDEIEGAYDPEGHFWYAGDFACIECAADAHVCEYTGRLFFSTPVRFDGRLTCWAYVSATQPELTWENAYLDAEGIEHVLSADARAGLAALFAALGAALARDPNQLDLDLEAA